MNDLEAQIKKIEDKITKAEAKEARWEKAWEKADNEENKNEAEKYWNQYATASRTLASLQSRLDRKEKELKKAEGNFLFFFFALYFSLFLSLVFLFSSSRLPWFLCLSTCWFNDVLRARYVLSVWLFEMLFFCFVFFYSFSLNIFVSVSQRYMFLTFFHLCFDLLFTIVCLVLSCFVFCDFSLSLIWLDYFELFLFPLFPDL